MKKVTKLILGFTLAIVMTSCNKEDDKTTITAEEAGINAKLDIANDDVSDIVKKKKQILI